MLFSFGMHLQGIPKHLQLPWYSYRILSMPPYPQTAVFVALLSGVGFRFFLAVRFSFQGRKPSIQTISPYPKYLF